MAQRVQSELASSAKSSGATSIGFSWSSVRKQICGNFALKAAREAATAGAVLIAQVQAHECVWFYSAQQIKNA